MNNSHSSRSVEALNEIRDMMKRSSRFLSLSGWSGVWAGTIAIVGAAIAWFDIHTYYLQYEKVGYIRGEDFLQLRTRLFVLGLVVASLAIIGGFYFTFRKNRKSGEKLWNLASRKMLINLAIPLFVGGVMILAFLNRGHWIYVAPACLVFYGLALINASKYTLPDIRLLGFLEIVLGCIGLVFTGWSLYLWALGFGALHILYGIIMWKKYEEK